jgi:hypothetical protein
MDIVVESHGLGPEDDFGKQVARQVIHDLGKLVPEGVKLTFQCSRMRHSSLVIVHYPETDDLEVQSFLKGVESSVMQLGRVCLFQLTDAPLPR